MAKTQKAPKSLSSIIQKLRNGDNHTLLQGEPDDRGEVLIVAVNKYKDNLYMSIRKWYDSDGELKPGKNGINLPLDAEGVDLLRDAVSKFEDVLQALD